MSNTPSVQEQEKTSINLPYAAKLPCLLRGSFYRFRKCPPSFYAVGKITKNGWREPFLSGYDMPNNWTEYLGATPRATVLDFDYMGPFFVRCDHGCSHLSLDGEGTSHGTASCTNGFEFRPARVFRQSESQIQRSGFLFVWAGIGEGALDTAYGSLVEIGIAHASRIPILIAHHPHADLRPFWFAVETASAVVCAKKPLQALEMLHNARRCGR